MVAEVSRRGIMVAEGALAAEVSWWQMYHGSRGSTGSRGIMVAEVSW